MIGTRKVRATATESAHDFLRYATQPLDAIFHPASVAVVGATESEGSVGRTIMQNLLATPFGGTVYPVNPKRVSVLGVRAYPTLTDVPERVDLIVVVTPAPTVPGIIAEAVELGIPGAIIISAGFKEIGPEGAELERQILEKAKEGNMRIIGPNCLGVMMPPTGLNATFAARMANPGTVGFISQSGALLTAVLDWSLQENVGFSAFVSIGSMLDVDWGDLIYYLGNDTRTESIVIYMETIGDARSFMSAAREVALTKPIIVIKPGRTEAAAQAAASHTGSLTGSDEVLEAAFRRSGVLRVQNINDLFNMAEVLAKQPRPSGRRLTIITNAGGPGVLATDALIMGDGELTKLTPSTMEALNELLPGPWSRGNPVDILGDASPDRYVHTLEILANDPNSDGLMVILTPQAMTDPTQTAEALRKYARVPGKPLLASWMGGADVAAGEAILNRSNIPTFPYPDTAARLFNYMWRYDRNLRSLYETPQLPMEEQEVMKAHEDARQMILDARAAGRTILTEYESKQVLAAYDIPIVDTRLAETPEDAVALAEEIGYPVVVKLNSKTITHKTDVGGVQLNLRNAEAVRGAYTAIEEAVGRLEGPEHFHGVTVQPMVDLSEAYELIVGSSPDPQFGPVLLFGSGGTLVEVFKDRALGLPPLNTTLARRMMQRTKIYEALEGIRGRDPVDLEELDKLLVRFSWLVSDMPWIREIDINPLLASAKEIVALDARVVLFDKETREEDLPRLAIRPYPTQYVQEWTTNDGTPVRIRPIRPEDEPLVAEFHEPLSEHSVYMRYFRALNLDQRTQHDRLTRICFIDYDREMALVVTRANPETGQREIIGVGRLSRMNNPQDAEFALLVSDKFQGQGLGSVLLEKLLDYARDEGIRRVMAYMLPENRPMRKIATGLGFSFEREDDLLKAEIEL
jgi:acetyltransferase